MPDSPLAPLPHIPNDDPSSDTIRIVERKDEKFDWVRRSKNGNIVSTSGNQGYENKAFARHMAETRNPGIVILPDDE